MCDCPERSERSEEESLDDADELPEPMELVTDAIGELQAAIADLNKVAALLETATVSR